MKMKKLFSIILSTVILATCCSALWSVSGLAAATDEWYACLDKNGASATLSDNGDGTVNVSGTGTVLSTATYDITKYDLKFKTTNFAVANDGSIYIGFSIAKPIDTDKITVDYAVGDASDRLDFQIYSSDKKLRLRQSNSYKKPNGTSVSVQPTYNTGAVTPSIEHTFGVRQVEGKWYPAIDGVIYRFEDLDNDYGRADILNNWIEEMNGSTGFRFGFVVKSNETATTAADISVVPITRFVDTADGVGETTVVSQEDGECTLSGVNNNFISTNAYDISSTDLSFYAGDLGNAGFVRLAVVAPFGKSYLINDEDWQKEYYNLTQLEFWYYLPNNQLVLKFKAAGEGAKQVWFECDDNGTNLRNQTCTFGFRYDIEDLKWYPAINGKVYKNYNTSKKWAGGNIGFDGIDGLEYIQRFIEANGTDLRFGIAANKEVTDFSVKNADVIDHTAIVDAESLASVKKYFLGADKLANKWFFDLNRDGNLDLVDLVKVKKASAENVVA